MALSLAVRSRAPELMDTEPVEFDEFRECLAQLEELNRWSLAYRPTLTWLARALGPGPVSLLDIGSGHGDMLRRIAGWAARRGVRMELTGIDLNPWSKRAAELATPPGMKIRFETGDLFAIDEGRRFDFVISSLFAHHLDDDQLVRFLRWMERHATRGWFVNDLHRHAVPYWFLRGLFALGRFNRMVVHDGPVSVARSLTRRDWEAALDRAGIDRRHVEIGWWAPFRWGIGRLK
jgi:SAM-dependent methyltransferase